MKGAHRIIVETKKIKYDFTVKINKRFVLFLTCSFIIEKYIT